MTRPSAFTPAARRLGVLTALLAAVAPAVAAAKAPVAHAADTTPLVGTFRITAGAESSSGPVGSYFRMILPGGTSKGTFLGNASSSSPDTSFTFLNPGTDGGLVTGSYQPEPTPPFSSGGNSLADSIITPTPFFSVNFSADTAAIDPQTKASVPAPAISTDSAGHLTGNLEAWGASWNHQEFNQGAPKPGGATPGITQGPTGSYDPTTGAYTLNWVSSIVGGPFNGFAGEWHLAGTFVPATAPANASMPTAGSTTSTATIGDPLVKARPVHPLAFLASDHRFLVQTGYLIAAPAGAAATTVAVTVRSATKGSVLLARHSVSVPAGTSAAVYFTLSHTAVERLRAERTLPFDWTITTTTGSAPPTTVTGTSTLRLR